MHLDNDTTLPDALVREIVRFVRPAGVRGLRVRVKPSRSWGSGVACDDCQPPYATVRIGGPDQFPRTVPAAVGSLPPVHLRGQVEALVFLTAHELRHHWQAGPGRGRFSGPERDADEYAARVLKAWRRG